MSNIHQEETFEASPAKVYQTLVDAMEFAKLTGCARNRHERGRRQLQPFRRRTSPAGRSSWFPIGWWSRLRRAKTWPAGVYSIARFAAAGGRSQDARRLRPRRVSW